MKHSPLVHLQRGMALLLVVVGCSAAQEAALPRNEFAQARAPREWKFPRDHGRHEEFQTEWWYYTGNLRSAEGRRYGYQLTFFRNALTAAAPARASRWAMREAYVAHFTLTDVAQNKFFYEQRMRRAALDLAGAAEESLAVHVGDWSAQARNDTMFLQAESERGSLALALLPQREVVLHGNGGLVQKGAMAGEASYYYSWPFLQTRGHVRAGEETLSVEGVSWMDHEFFSSPVASEVAGWDWFSLHLSDSSAIMLYLLRKADGSLSPYSAGTWMTPQQSLTVSFSAEPREWWQSAKTGARYPIAWEVRVRDYDLRVTAVVREQELDTRQTTGVIYWEGYIEVIGTRMGRAITGMGYLEMTGYAARVALNVAR